MTVTEQLEGWAIVEPIGPPRVAGYVTEQEVAGGRLLRVDVPGDPPGTRWFSLEAVRVTPTSEEMARAIAKRRGEPDTHLQCTQCGRTSTTNFASSLRSGWEKCCGLTMRLVRTEADVGEATREAMGSVPDLVRAAGWEGTE